MTERKADASMRIQITLFFSYVSIFLIGLVAGIALAHNAENINTNPRDDNIIASMTVDYGEGDIQTLPKDIIAPYTTLALYLELIEKRYGIPIEIRRIGDASFVESFHNIHATENSEWIYEIDGKVIGSDPLKYIVKDGDAIVWRRVMR